MGGAVALLFAADEANVGLVLCGRVSHAEAPAYLALCDVVVVAGDDEGAGAEIHRGVQAAGLEVRPQHLLGHRDAVGAVRADLLRGVERGVHQPGVRHHARDEADALRFGRRDLAPGQNQLEGVRGAKA